MILKARLQASEVREQLGRILSSRTFGPRSAVHTLLSWLVERTLADPETPIKEYSIGVEAFGRSQGYDPQQDAYVRVQAGKLRLKLHEYYFTEGAQDRIRIELPKRQFLLEFSETGLPSAEAATSPVPAVAAGESAESSRRWLLPALGSVLLVWAIAATLLAVRAPHQQALPSALRTVWSGFLDGGRPTLISLGTHQFYSYSGGFLREPSLDGAEPAEVAERLKQLQLKLGGMPLEPRQGYTGTGQATGAFLLGQFFGTAEQPARLVRSSSLTWDDISGNNVIFLGSAKSNPQIRSIPVDRPFRIEGESIVNSSPAAGEPASWEYTRGNAGGDRQEYALMTFAPGLHGAGEILIIEAPTTTGMWAGALYLSDPAYAAELVERVRTAGSHPTHYQVVIRLDVQNQVPLRLRYASHRVLR